MTTHNRRAAPERRQGPDCWNRAMHWIAVTIWGLMLTALLIVGWAKPQVETFFDRYYQLALRSTWDMDLAKYIFYCMTTGLLLSLIGLTINQRRHRRRDDEYLVSLILSAAICVSGICLYLYSF
ncbi:MAG: hypothetical protein A2X84_03440 [Desulfuromonadaceae bacterium GWC2_58_13]|nr:MAG: hypothetical protein A2X84_03440 [Desulfuromonadaceae bacterium GWC2_58_13]